MIRNVCSVPYWKFISLTDVFVIRRCIIAFKNIDKFGCQMLRRHKICTWFFFMGWISSITPCDHWNSKTNFPINFRYCARDWKMVRNGNFYFHYYFYLYSVTRAYMYFRKETFLFLNRNRNGYSYRYYHHCCLFYQK